MAYKAESDDARVAGPPPSCAPLLRDRAPVYGWDTLVLLKHLLDQGLNKTAIAERLGISRGLVYHLIKTGQLERDLSTPPARRKRTPHPAKLEPYQAIITTRLTTYPELSAVRLFEECRAAGLPGIDADGDPTVFHLDFAGGDGRRRRTVP